MIFLRLACLMAGILVLVAPPVVLFPNGASAPEVSRSAALLAAMLLAASGFFFIGMTGHRIKRSPALGRMSAAALLLTFVAGSAILWDSAEPTAMWLSGALLGFTLIVSLALTLLMLQGPSAGRVRAREGRQSRLSVVHHL
ncbi:MULTISPECIES: hypothetical protein [unclassified Massilia]|uniref:hypothetical protein n=1 Tax=unclassified Massilia TaxID=2609279 RepID=UPI0004E35BF3|nr:MULTISPECIES: hypothetical protein [unclassified Massilia]KFC71954.1 hypothetical protein FG94_01987 [Massilia sp. LC238]